MVKILSLRAEQKQHDIDRHEQERSCLAWEPVMVGGPEPAELNQGSGWLYGRAQRQGGGGGEQDYQDGS